MTRCENCGSFEDCLVVNDLGDEIIVCGDDPEEYGTLICPDCYSMIYGGGWREDWFRDDWR